MSKNKPRHPIKQNGSITKNWCIHCGCYNCDPMLSPLHPTRAMQKRSYRYENKLCIGCGNKNCTCKNKKGY